MCGADNGGIISQFVDADTGGLLSYAPLAHVAVDPSGAMLWGSKTLYARGGLERGGHSLLVEVLHSNARHCFRYGICAIARTDSSWMVVRFDGKGT